MKTNTYKIFIATLITSVMLANLAFGQWTFNPSTGTLYTIDKVGIGTNNPVPKFEVLGESHFAFMNNYTDPDPGVAYDAKFASPTRGIAVSGISIFKNNVGIGTTAPVTLLHVDGSTANTGDVFRTTSPTGKIAAWTMFTGTSTTAEKFSITIPAGTSNAVLQTKQAGGRFLFNTGGAITHMIIVDGTPLSNTTIGYVAIGNNLPNNFNPTARLHLHESNGNTNSGTPFIRFTNQNSGAGTTTGYENTSAGYEMGITYNGEADLINWEPQPIIIFTNNGGHTAAQRMIIQPVTGNVGIGAIVPPSLLSVGPNSEFQVKNNGDMISIKSLKYSWPTTYFVGTTTYLQNDGLGNLTWATGGAGIIGATGYSGATGATGNNGTNGATGATGTTGSMGQQGFPGLDGMNGFDGHNGTNGTNGATGVTGATGSSGIDGTNGTNGITGATGTDGTNGITGATGPGTICSGATTGYVTKFTSPTEMCNSIIYDNNTNVGISNILPLAKLHITGTGNNTQLIVQANTTPPQLQSNTNPLIKLIDASGTDLMWIHSDHQNNAFIGYQAGMSNTPNTPTPGFSGLDNTFIGSFAGSSNSSGYLNTATGSYSLYGNQTGFRNTANGVGALEFNLSGNDNTAVGADALAYNSVGVSNTAIGSSALGHNNTIGSGFNGHGNTACGRGALEWNTTGNFNTALGTNSGQLITTGYNNTYIGGGASSSDNLYSVTVVGVGANAAGNTATALGANAHANADNSTALGFGATANAPSTVMIGNSTNIIVGSPAGQFVISSDGRFKTNVTENVKGLKFIKKLRPVTFNMNTSALDDFLIQNMSDSLKTLHKAGMDFTASTAIVRSGFIAQEVNQAAQDVSFTSSIVHTPANNSDPYALAYGEFVVPLVKAVQELDSITSIGIKAKGTPIINKLTKFTAIDSISNSQLFDDGTNVGINTITPTNKLEVNSGIANSSGLTFTNLTLASTALPANGKALSVSSTGEVILTNGTIGVTGVTGGTGNNGTDGTTGATGSNGTNGTIGATGANGNIGMTGNTGMSGLQGNSGINGANGNTGAIGVTGTTGNNGTNGVNGATGNNGANGTNGNTGATGNNGIDGTNGATGANGIIGMTGNTGMPGLPGNPGINGVNGNTGAIGVTGATGNNGTNGVNGATGSNGTNGIIGATGANGNIGITGNTGMPGLPGNPGINGANGNTGAIGVTGATGNNGINGTNGANGVTGATGNNGTNGTNGIIGATGANGIIGMTGNTGMPGLPGNPGINGANGNTGAIGVTGATGNNGTNGANGVTGATGSNGTNGINGANGNTGATGNNGTIGATGADGALNAWSLTGNAGTVDGTNFIGTIDNKPFNIKVNNQKAGRIDPTLYNTFWGYQSANANTTASRNTALGYQALYTQSYNNGGSAWNSDNVAIGYQALFSNQPTASSYSGNWNVAVGNFALHANTTGRDNIALGYEAMLNNTTGLDNIAIGYDALQNYGAGSRCIGIGYQALAGSGTPANNTAQNNIAFGWGAMFSSTTGGENQAFGQNALYHNTSGGDNQGLGDFALYLNISGNDNVAIGNNALSYNTSGNQNVGIGKSALYNNTGNYSTGVGEEALSNAGAYGGTANNNTGLGYHAGQNLANGSNNTYLGYNANTTDGLSNATSIGANALVTASNSLVLGSSANVGIGTTAPAYKFEVVGDANFNGVVHTSSGTVVVSDQHFKTNITNLSTVKSIIDSLKPKTFYFDTTNVNGINFPKAKQYGFIAQDIEHVLPDLVATTIKQADIDTSGHVVHPAVTYKSLNYNAFFGILTKGIQEEQHTIDSLKTKTTKQDSVNTALQKAQQKSIDSLRTTNTIQNTLITSMQNQINQLASLINDCCNKHDSHSQKSMIINDSTPQGGTTFTDVELSNKHIVVLNQNVPNPFAEQTTITYYLPDDFKRAQIIFLELSGKIIRTVDLTVKGKGTLNVFANDLTNGIYTYSLIIDGQTIETKKMVKE